MCPPKKFRCCRWWAKRRTTISTSAILINDCVQRFNTRGTKTPTRVVNITGRVSKPTVEIGGATGSREITCVHNLHGSIPTYKKVPTQECSCIYSQQKATPDFPVYLMGCTFSAAMSSSRSDIVTLFVCSFVRPSVRHLILLFFKMNHIF